MRLVILGIGDAFTRNHFGCSALIEAPSPQGDRPRYVLLDCPDPIHRVLNEGTAAAGWSVHPGQIDDIILTHLHGDHSNGLESFGFARLLCRAKHPDLALPRLHTNRPASERLWEKLAPAMDGSWAGDTPRTLADIFDVRVLEPERPATIAGLTVRCRFTKHPVPTIGLLISDGKRTLGWSSDTPYEQAHVDWLSGADLIVHESNDSPVHTPIDALNALPASLRKKMRLMHLQDEFNRASTEIAMLRQGEVLTI